MSYGVIQIFKIELQNTQIKDKAFLYCLKRRLDIVIFLSKIISLGKCV